MQPETVQIELPKALLERAHLETTEETRRLLSSLLERHVADLERAERVREYEGYYETRSREDDAEEAELLADFSFADSQASEEPPE